MKKTVAKIIAFLVACLFLLGIVGPLLLSMGMRLLLMQSWKE